MMCLYFDDKMANEKFLKIQKLVKNSLEKFYKNDLQLFNISRNGPVGERAMVFRIGVYMQDFMSQDEMLREYNIDCEYNRNIEDVKKINDRLVIPDLIIHKRLTNNDNFLCIEFKKNHVSSASNNAVKCDWCKLRFLTDKKNDYRYEYGLHVILNDNALKKWEVKVFVDGRSSKNLDKYFV